MITIDTILKDMGLVGSSGGESQIYESVTNLTSSSNSEGTQILVTWTNPTVNEYVKTELFTSTTDISNLNYEQVVLNATKVVNGALSTYTKTVTVGTTHYFKAYVTYSSFGEIVISKGVTTFATATDTTPPNPITNFKVDKEDSNQVVLSWINPTNPDFNKTKIVYKTGSYPTSQNDGLVAYEGSGMTTTVNGLINNTEYFFRAFTFDNSGNINDSTSGMQITATPSDAKIYGVKIDTLNSNPETALTYIDNAVGYTPAKGNNGNFSYGSWQDKFPFNQIKPCVVKNGVVNYYLNPNDYTKKLDGGNADIASGNDGDVMIEFPKIYWKFETIGNDLYVRYADKQADLTYKCLAHTRGASEKDEIYLSAYMGFSLSSKLRSLSGKTPTTNQNISQFRTLAKANGAGYEQSTYYQILMLQVLFIVMFKNRDSQTALGRGYVDGNSSSIATGGTNIKGMFYGETTGKLQNKFCGIEDFWGNTFYWADGMYYDASRNILIGNDNYNNTGNGYTNYGQGATANVSGYIDKVQGGTETGFIIKSGSGSGTTYYADYGYLVPSYSPRFGGNWSSSGTAGAFQLDVSISNSTSVSSLSARLSLC